MASFPVVNFTQYQWEVNDQDYLVKWNNFQIAITSMQSQINDFGAEVTQEVMAAADSAQASAQSAAEARQYRDEAQQIAVGDVAITDLEPGQLTQPKDYVTVDESGALAVRNVADDIDEQMTSGEQSINIGTYGLRRQVLSGPEITIDLSQSLVYEVNNDQLQTISFINFPSSEEIADGKVAYIKFIGNAGTNFPPTLPEGVTLDLDGGEPPEFADVFTFWVCPLTANSITIGRGFSA